MADDWSSVKASFKKKFFASLKIAGDILIDALLFVLWVLIDHLASKFIDWLHVERGFHEYVAFTFRCIASGTILFVALSMAFSDVIEVIGTLRTKWHEMCRSVSRPLNNSSEGVSDEPL
ncbi:MAG TPA: hypothetical protein VMV69_11525 [Pirellulales bacterium]|nr:hypothetical protein [Pirellulales bacterium]